MILPAASLIVLIMTFLLALFLSLWGTPVAGSAATRFGIVDRPDGKLKRHEASTPYFGGLSIFTSFLVALSVAFRFDRHILGILLAGTIVTLLGLIDDLGALSPGVKLIGQLVAVWCLINSDVRIKIAAFPPWLQIVSTVLWVMVMTNAVNLIDIMDGLAAGVCIVIAVVLLVNSLLNGSVNTAITAACLTGACLGFLRYNLPKAGIFMGDTGSMFLGLTLAAISMSEAYAQTNPLAVLSPLLILSVPLFELTFVSAIRAGKGQSIFRGSPDHIALRLKEAGWSTKKILAAAYGFTAFMGAAATLNRFVGRSGSLILLACCALVFIVAGVLLARVAMPRKSCADPEDASRHAPGDHENRG